MSTAWLRVYPRRGPAWNRSGQLDAGLHLYGTPDPHDRVWADRGFTAREPYVQQLAPAYGAAPATLDLAGGPEGSREAINAWVAEHARDRIPELFPTGTPTPDSRPASPPAARAA